MQLRSAAVPDRSKVDSAKALDFSARVEVTLWCVNQRVNQSFMKTIVLGCLVVAAPEDGRTRVCIVPAKPSVQSPKLVIWTDDYLTRQVSANPTKAKNAFGDHAAIHGRT